MITIVDYGSGNIEAIANIYKRLNIPYQISPSVELLEHSEKLILPGVGAFDKTMHQLNESGLRAKLDELVIEKKIPVLGVCVGMQIMSYKSEEGHLSGLGWIEGEVKKIDTTKFTHKPHVPHMGWNTISDRIKHPILNNLEKEKGFYFLHSFYFSCHSEKNILCTTTYGNEFASGVFSDNIFGMQFHPEKSHSNGIQLLKNFAEL